ncbi:MAG TPA: MBL fold hydrolase, partial [Clostridiales bacterium]|nr:MBL fold hydrolase [Clostridiales bacterium]
RRAHRAGQTAYTPLYTAQDVHKTMELFTSCDYNHTYDVCEGIQIRFLDAGHLLGSASIEIVVTEHNI